MARIKMGKKRRWSVSEKKKAGQVTLFIILGIIIISAILVFFIFIKPDFITSKGNINFQNCVKELVEKSTTELEQNAGFVRPEFTYLYQSENIAYLCYTNEYYKTCTVQKPFLKQHFEEQLGIYIDEEINNCYQNALSELRSQGYSVTGGKLKYNISIVPQMIKVEIEAPTSVDSRKFTRFNVLVDSPIYDVLMIATSILQFEAKYGDSDTSSFSSFYQDYYITKIKRDDGTKVYTIENKINKDKFKFASRSLVLPAGYI